MREYLFSDFSPLMIVIFIYCLFFDWFLIASYARILQKIFKIIMK